jgi:DNA modification methylase
MDIRHRAGGGTGAGGGRVPDVRKGDGVNDAVLIGNVLDILPTLEAQSVNCVVTSPPYWGLRDYGTDGQLGLEPTPEEYVAKMVAVFREVRRVLRDDGTLWLNLGDSYASDPGKGGSGTPNGRNGRGENYGRAMRAGAGRADGIVDERGQRNRDGTPTGHGLKAKDLVGIPWRVAFALQADGWYLRSDIIWSKPNPMPESVTDRPTKAHEYLFLMSKAARYWYDAEAINERAEFIGPNGPGRKGSPSEQNFYRICGRNGEDGDRTRNRRTVWTIATQPYPEAHFATYPEKLVEPCVLAGCPVSGLVLDPFAGSGTTGAVAYRLGRKFVGIELNPEYAAMAERRIAPHRDQMQLAVES